MELANCLEITSVLGSWYLVSSTCRPSRPPGSLAPTLCGSQSFRKIIFVTSFWDEVAGEIGKEREQALVDRYLWREIEDGAKTGRFDDSRELALRVLREMADSKIVLDVQKELVEKSKPFHKTAIGAELQAGISENKERVQVQAESLTKRINSRRDAQTVKILKMERGEIDARSGLKEEEARLRSYIK
ncbi:hypothetical protein BCR34DRAFT_504490 [Clohesyomyces aquaticus]|uniref:Uncharacterized protein n=1 Tax=Clohesyomyces aquaticus TaxID=1231657 RepID=A0A1Y2A969_9PLEO|nr:hypothetical protein BCR34DRAFT_504490 [Clohesyomyces aquaticus]